MISRFISTPFYRTPFDRLFEDRRYMSWFYLLGTIALGTLACLFSGLGLRPSIVACAIAILVVPFHFFLEPIYEYWTLRPEFRMFLDQNLPGPLGLSPLRKKLDRAKQWIWVFLGVTLVLQLYFVRELLAVFALFALGFSAIAMIIGLLYVVQRAIAHLNLIEIAQAKLKNQPGAARTFESEAR